MFTVIFSIFIILHGLVHLLYLGQSARYFELQPEMVWPDGSWVFASVLGEEGSRTLASIFLVWAAIAFVGAGLGILAGQSWWRPMLAGTAVFSSAIFVLFWDGGTQQLANKGGVAILINLALLIGLLAFRWPGFDF